MLQIELQLYFYCSQDPPPQKKSKFLDPSLPGLCRIQQIFLMRTEVHCLTSASLANRDNRTVSLELLCDFNCWTVLPVGLLL